MGMAVLNMCIGLVAKNSAEKSETRLSVNISSDMKKTKMH